MIRLDDLWNAADDGAHASIGPIDFPSGAERASLLDAWFRERQHSIEFEILLDESRRMLRRLVTEGHVTPRTKQMALQLIRTINQTFQAAEQGEVGPT